MEQGKMRVRGLSSGDTDDLDLDSPSPSSEMINDKKLLKLQKKETKKLDKLKKKQEELQAKEAARLEKYSNKVAKHEEKLEKKREIQRVKIAKKQAKRKGSIATSDTSSQIEPPANGPRRGSVTTRDPRTAMQVGVQIAKNSEGSMGFACLDATDKNDFPVINQILENSPADRSRNIVLGDRLKSINGISCKGKSKPFVYELVKSAEDMIQLQILKTGCSYRCVTDEDVVCMRNEPDLAARVHVNVQYGETVASSGTVLGEDGIEYVAVAYGRGFFPLKHPETKAPLFKKIESNPSEMLAGLMNPELQDQGPATPPVGRRKVQINLKDSLTPDATTTDSPSYEVSRKFSFVHTNERHTKLEGPAYASPVEMVDEESASHQDSSYDVVTMMPSDDQKVEISKYGQSGPADNNETPPPYRAETSRFVHIVEPKTKTEGKVWAEGLLPSGLDPRESDGMFVIRVHRRETDYVISIYFKGNLTEHLINCEADGSSTINNRRFGTFSTIDEMIDVLSNDPLPVEPESGRPWPVRLSRGCDKHGNMVAVGKPPLVSNGTDYRKLSRSDSSDITTESSSDPGYTLPRGRAATTATGTASSKPLQRDRMMSLGVKHGDIKASGQVGGFTETRLPWSKNAREAVRTIRKSKSTMILAIKIENDGTENEFRLDFLEPMTGSFNAASVKMKLNPSDPRYYVIVGKNIGGAVFIYCCPSSSKRTDRMLYATSKKNVLEVLEDLGKLVPEIRTELSDIDELTDAELKGEQPNHTSPPTMDHPKGIAKTEFFAPEEQAGSLSALLAQAVNNGGIGDGVVKKKIVRPPPGAYG